MERTGKTLFICQSGHVLKSRPVVWPYVDGLEQFNAKKNYVMRRYKNAREQI